MGVQSIVSVTRQSAIEQVATHLAQETLEAIKARIASWTDAQLEDVLEEMNGKSTGCRKRNNFLIEG